MTALVMRPGEQREAYGHDGLARNADRGAEREREKEKREAAKCGSGPLPAACVSLSNELLYYLVLL